MAVVGHDGNCTGTGGIATGIGGEVRWGLHCTAPATGTITEIKIYIHFFSARADKTADADIMCAIYDFDSVSGTHDLIEVTEVINFTQPAGIPPANDDWNSALKVFQLDSTVNITSGNEYLICVQGQINGATSGSTYIKIDTDGSGSPDFDLEAETTAYTGSWSDPWNPPTDAANWRMWCYAEITGEGTNMKVNVGDTFKDVSEIKINVGDAWKDVTEAKVNVGDTWKEIF
jgi:hypothetical protein